MPSMGEGQKLFLDANQDTWLDRLVEQVDRFLEEASFHSAAAPPPPRGTVDLAGAPEPEPEPDANGARDAGVEGVRQLDTCILCPSCRLEGRLDAHVFTREQCAVELKLHRRSIMCPAEGRAVSLTELLPAEVFLSYRWYGWDQHASGKPWSQRVVMQTCASLEVRPPSGPRQMTT